MKMKKKKIFFFLKYIHKVTTFSYSIQLDEKKEIEFAPIKY